MITRPGSGPQCCDGSAYGRMGGQAHEARYPRADQAVRFGHGPERPERRHRLD